jgi:hypothetical protein
VALSFTIVTGEVMTQQGSGYPAQPPKHAGEKGADRLREMAETATDQLKGAADRVQQLAGDVSRQAREYVKRRRMRQGRSGLSSKSPLGTADDDAGRGGGDRVRARRPVEEVVQA